MPSHSMAASNVSGYSFSSMSVLEPSSRCPSCKEELMEGSSRALNRRAISKLMATPTKEGGQRTGGRKSTKTGKAPKKASREVRDGGTAIDSRSPKTRSRRSVSRDRASSAADLRSETAVRRRAGSLPKRMKTLEKKSSRYKRENDATKKEATIRRTKSCESLSAARSPRKQHRSTSTSRQVSNQSFSALEIPTDERGLPLTSLGCPAVASLRRTSSPTNVDTDNFDVLYAYKLQMMEDCSARSSRPSPGIEMRCSSLEDHSPIVTEDNDKKPAAKPRSKSSKRASRKEEKPLQNLVPLNPEESLNHHRKRCTTEAKAFVHRLKSLVENELFSKKAIFSVVLTDDELVHLVVSMFQKQSQFRKQGKPAKVDVGYHFCRSGNIKRIQMQPGFWSKIQAKGVNKSQDGDGIYTLNHPQLSKASLSNGCTNDGDVWMAVARLQGMKRSHTIASRRLWSGDEDAMVQSEGEVVVLKSPTQFFPLVQFRSAILRPGNHTSAAFAEMQQGLQVLMEDFFNQRKPLHPPDNPQTIQRHLSFGDGTRTVPNPAAWEFANEVRAVIEEYMGAAAPTTTKNYDEPVFMVQSVVEEAEMTLLADNMFRTQNRFRESNKPTYLEIGYHYCRGQNLRKMHPGFWSAVQLRGFNKSEDGDGIYTFNDPLGGRRGNRPGGFFDVRKSMGNEYDVWLVVARLQGNRQSLSLTANNGLTSTGRNWDRNVDAMITNGRNSDDVVVLRTSAQFFPLLQFPAESTDDQEETMQVLQIIHQRLQGILDQFFNGEVEAVDDFINLNGEEEVLEYCAPDKLDLKKSTQSQQIYRILSNNKKASNDDCSICLDSLRLTSHQKVVRLKNCGHEFHLSCLHEVFANHFELCPICNQPVVVGPQSCLQGLSPSGIMAVTTSTHTFCGRCWAPKGSLLISFFIPAGLQKDYMSNPGHGHMSSFCRTILPNNQPGARLLRRLQYAFLHGLLFTVDAGTQTQGSDAIISLASVTLKTCGSSSDSPEDSYEFPSPEDLVQWNCELDRCGVPEYTSCRDFILLELDRAGKTTDFSSGQTLTSEEIAGCLRILEGLQSHRHGWLFCKALPPITDKVERPMDLTTIENKLASQGYSSVDDYQSDVLLTFQNAMCCHSKDNPIHYMAKQLKKKFKKDLKHMLEGTSKDET